MTPVQHTSCNAVLGAPRGIKIEECKALAIRRVLYEGGLAAVQSFWKPNAEELALLNAGHPVQLELWGVTMPPALLTVAADRE